MERPVLVPVFSNQKKPEKDFPFYKNRRKTEIAFSVGVAAVITEAACTPRCWGGPTKLLSRELHSFLSIKPP